MTLKMFLVSVRYLVYQPMDETIITWTLRALSIYQNWPARPLPDQLFWQWNRLFPGVLLKNHLLPAYYLGFDWCNRIVLINSEILITSGRVWPVSSDKWKVPLVYPTMEKAILFDWLIMLQYDFKAKYWLISWSFFHPKINGNTIN